MVVEVVAIAAGLKAAVSAVKSGMETAKDISDIANQINTVFNHKDALEKRLGAHEKKKDKGMLSFFSRKTEEDADDETSMAAAMDTVVHKKLLDAQMRNLKIMLNNKYGPSTWDEIVKVREQRVQAKKERDALAREKANKKAKADKAFWDKLFTEGGKAIIILLVVGAMYWYLSWAYHNK